MHTLLSLSHLILLLSLSLSYSLSLSHSPTLLLTLTLTHSLTHSLSLSQEYLIQVIDPHTDITYGSAHRFREFVSMHAVLKKLFPKVKFSDLPMKRIAGSLNRQTVCFSLSLLFWWLFGLMCFVACSCTLSYAQRVFFPISQNSPSPGGVSEDNARG
jgi:PX domain